MKTKSRRPERSSGSQAKTPERPARGHAAKMDREIQDWVTKVQARGPAIRRAPGFRVVVDQARIPRADLQIALANARHDPDGQQFPWRPEALSQNPVRTG